MTQPEQENADSFFRLRWFPVLTFILFIFFFVGGPDYYSPRSVKAFWNAGHIIFFALFSYQLLRHPKFLPSNSRSLRIVVCLLVAFFLGVLIEIVQSGLSRNVSIDDISNNMLGALIGLFISPLRQQLSKAIRYCVAFVLLCLLLLQVIPWVAVLLDEISARQSFPVLSDFEQTIEKTRWTGSAITEVNSEKVISGEKSLQILLGTEKYSGLSLSYFNEDWSGFRELQLSVYNPDNPLEIIVRIHDRQHVIGEQLYSDRFNRRFTLQQGWNTLSIPLDEVAAAPATRVLDLATVLGLAIFVIKQPLPRTIYLDNVRLVSE